MDAIFVVVHAVHEEAGTIADPDTLHVLDSVALVTFRRLYHENVDIDPLNESHFREEIRTGLDIDPGEGICGDTIRTPRPYPEVKLVVVACPDILVHLRSLNFFRVLERLFYGIELVRLVESCPFPF